LDPAHDRRVSQRQPAFRHHFHKVSVAELVSQIPAYAENDDVPIEMPAFEKIIDAQHPRSPLAPPTPIPATMPRSWGLHQSRYFDAAAGYNIAGPEVEAALLSHGEVRECAVIGVADCDRGQIVEAHVVLAEGVPPDEATRKRLQDHVKATIAPYKYPRSLRFVERCQKRRRARSSAFA
jgi:hypothetical protein